MNWTGDEDELLTTLWQDNVPAAEIGRRLKRTTGAVTRRAHTIDLPLRKSLLGAKSSERRRRYDLEGDN